MEFETSSISCSCCPLFNKGDAPERRKVRVNSRHFAVVGHRLFRRGTNGLLKRCVSEAKMPSILIACHDSACGGHFSGELTSQKILRSRYF